MNDLYPRSSNSERWTGLKEVESRKVSLKFFYRLVTRSCSQIQSPRSTRLHSSLLTGNYLIDFFLGGRAALGQRLPYSKTN